MSAVAERIFSHHVKGEICWKEKRKATIQALESC